MNYNDRYDEDQNKDHDNEIGALFNRHQQQQQQQHSIQPKLSTTLTNNRQLSRATSPLSQFNKNRLKPTYTPTAPAFGSSPSCNNLANTTGSSHLPHMKMSTIKMTMSSINNMNRISSTRRQREQDSEEEQRIPYSAIVNPLGSIPLELQQHQQQQQIALPPNNQQSDAATLDEKVEQRLQKLPFTIKFTENVIRPMNNTPPENPCLQDNANKHLSNPHHLTVEIDTDSQTNCFITATTASAANYNKSTNVPPPKSCYPVASVKTTSTTATNINTNTASTLPSQPHQLNQLVPAPQVQQPGVTSKIIHGKPPQILMNHLNNNMSIVPHFHRIHQTPSQTQAVPVAAANMKQYNHPMMVNIAGNVPTMTPMQITQEMLTPHNMGESIELIDLQQKQKQLHELLQRRKEQQAKELEDHFDNQRALIQNQLQQQSKIIHQRNINGVQLGMRDNIADMKKKGSPPLLNYTFGNYDKKQITSNSKQQPPQPPTRKPPKPSQPQISQLKYPQARHLRNRQQHLHNLQRSPLIASVSTKSTMSNKLRLRSRNLPSATEIANSIPSHASSIFHVFDRRVNFDSLSSDCSIYSMMRSWVQDDPYRVNEQEKMNLMDTVLSNKKIDKESGKMSYYFENNDTTKGQEDQSESNNNNERKEETTIDVLGRIKLTKDAPQDMGHNNHDRNIQLLTECIVKAKRKKFAVKTKRKEKLAQGRKRLRSLGIKF